MSICPPVSLKGEVYYQPRIALPTGCKLIVTLSDISLADAPAHVVDVSETEITHQVPLPFELNYAADRYPVQGHSYALSARIERNGTLIWINHTAHLVELTNEDQKGLRIKVFQAAG